MVIEYGPRCVCIKSGVC